jgi:hypothetical protein
MGEHAGLVPAHQDFEKFLLARADAADKILIGQGRWGT